MLLIVSFDEIVAIGTSSIDEFIVKRLLGPIPFAFGLDSGDTVATKGDESSSGPITLDPPVAFLGVDVAEVFANINGCLSLNEPSRCVFIDDGTGFTTPISTLPDGDVAAGAFILGADIN